MEDFTLSLRQELEYTETQLYHICQDYLTAIINKKPMYCSALAKYCLKNFLVSCWINHEILSEQNICQKAQHFGIVIVSLLSLSFFFL